MTPTRIQLRLQHHAGQRLDAVWAIVSPLVQQSPPSLSGEVLTLRLPFLGEGKAVPVMSWNNFGWTLGNYTTDAQIFVNDQAIAPGHVCHVAIGDTLDIGLCKFLIESTEQPAAKDPNAIVNSMTDARPYGNLSIDALMVSLSAEQSFNSNDVFESLPADATTLPAQHEPKEVIEHLNDAYLLALRDPDSGLTIHTQDQVHITASLPHLPTDDKSLTLEEIISSKLDIDTIAERFNDLGNSVLMEREQCDDVLWLFAPEGQTPPKNHRLPPRSRQDHHLMSLDSSYHIATKSQVHTQESPAR